MEDLIREYRQALDRFSVKQENTDPQILKRHIPLLETLDHVENSSAALYNMQTQSYSFLTSKFHFLLDYDAGEARKTGPGFFFLKMYPEDLPRVMETTIKTFEFLSDRPGDERKDFKLCFDYRIRRADGVGIRMVQQVVVLETDFLKNIWLVLAVNDICPVQDIHAPLKRFLKQISTGRHFLFYPENNPTQPVLSPRELEVLGLIAQGFISREIADYLHISVNTVNNHRQNILEKMSAGNCFEAVKTAAKLNLI